MFTNFDSELVFSADLCYNDTGDINGQTEKSQDHSVERCGKRNSVPSRFVSTFKRFCNKEYGVNIWQYRSNDHIIRNRQNYDEHLRYIYENPMRWYYDELYAEE